jgi:hypothetical protein
VITRRRRRTGWGPAGRAWPTTGGDWALGRRPAPFVVEAPAPYRPELLMLLDVGAGRLIAVEPVAPGSSPTAVAEWASGKLRPGIRLRVDDRALAQAVRRRAGKDVEVLEAPTPEIDGAVDSFEAFTARTRGGRGREPAWADGAAADAKARFYVAAEHFEQARPWESASDGHVLAIDVPSMDWTGACVSILGNAEETFGLLLLRSLADYVRFVRLGDAVFESPRRAPGAGVPLFSVNFDRPRDLPGGKRLAAEARAHGFVPGARGRVPYILNFSPDAVATPLTTDDYRLATACLEAVGRFVEQHVELFTTGPRERFQDRSTIDLPGGNLEVVVICPPPDLPWRWGEQEPIEGLRERDRDEIVADFGAARRAGGASPEEADADGWAAREMLEFKAQRGGRLTEWLPEDVAAYLLEYYPSHGSETGEELAAIPSRLDAFLAWLGASRRGPSARMAAARKSLAECREAFLRDARDPRRFGVAKTVVQAMRAAGVEPGDPAAVDSFMGDFQRRLADDPSLLPTPTLPVKRQDKAWVWNGEDPAPDARGACPCGSGRRYRRCCMPR